MADADWSFPDTAEGIREALRRGARTLWANTVLYSDHPLATDYGTQFHVVGQRLQAVEYFDDKDAVNNGLLRRAHLPVARSLVVRSLAEADASRLRKKGLRVPLVVKPVRGRGSEGVMLAETNAELGRIVENFLLGARRQLALES